MNQPPKYFFSLEEITAQPKRKSTKVKKPIELLYCPKKPFATPKPKEKLKARITTPINPFFITKKIKTSIKNF